ncbi:MAG TPA: divalent-cation tolerance protein CutA [Dehalococcoidia bacterium]|nr:divalent-cation tolerance protein CutA [Dehalococcoidia bacterium]
MAVVSEHVIAMVTAPLQEAESLSRAIVEAKLAACVHVLQAGRSTYWWEGKIEEADEQTLIIKTRQTAIGGLRELLDEKHPYDVYELVVLAVTDGNPAYLSWITDSVAAS